MTGPAIVIQETLITSGSGISKSINVTNSNFVTSADASINLGKTILNAVGSINKATYLTDTYFSNNVGSTNLGSGI